ELGIAVFSTPDAPTIAVAELTVGLILNILRKITIMDSLVKAGKWEKMMGNLLNGKKIGIIGFGRIGKKVASLLEPFGCSITYYDPFVEDGASGLSRLSKEDLIRWAEILTLHVSTKELVLGKKELCSMKKGAWLINVSRGGTIDETSLYELLKNGYLGGAALDVFENEPYRGSLG
ncbi:MAG: hydroxyacid dehydrogenase, partial [Candidatus Omnitrophica bacterium]|nr:hydroxyacid dehydrogenase [Candidatus Omnitrophota bacterium]